MSLAGIYLVHILCLPLILRAELSDTNLNEVSEQQNAVRINKCCETNELVIDSSCRLAETYNKTLWKPKFKTYDGEDTHVKYFVFVPGKPDCETTQQRAIFSFKNSEDELHLLSDGKLKHLIHHEHKSDSLTDEPYSKSFGLHDTIVIPDAVELSTYIHEHNKYCLDKVFITKTNVSVDYALVCIPEVKINWRDTDFLMRKILNPIFHSISMICFLIVAIIYFVIPTLRDLAGNIITTINMCLIVAQAADLVRSFTELSNHVSFMIADVILYVSLLGTFFWLNSFGFYVWKTFKSRNVFLRVTDVRKYCYYSSVVWSCVILMTAMAVCAHFLLDSNQTRFSSSALADDEEQETIGWLGIAIFFTPVAFTILFDVFFYVTTLKVVHRINIYGRIHYKLKGCLDLFLQLFLIISIWWLFLLLSWLDYSGLIYAYVCVNACVGLLVLYVCVLRQGHVTFLIRKSCCYEQPVPTNDWGDEMTNINGHYAY